MVLSLGALIDRHVMPIVDRIISATQIFNRGSRAHIMAQTINQERYVTLGLISSTYSDAWSHLKNYSEAWDNVDSSFADVHKPLLEWRAYLTSWLVNQAMFVEGDFVELGVQWGVLSKHYLLETDLKDRRVWLFDVWGDSEEFLSHPEMPSGAGSYEKDIYEAVRKRFAQFTNVEMVRGFVPETLKALSGNKIAYLSLDMNSWIPEMQSLEMLWEQVSVGGVVYFDDIGYENYFKLREVVGVFLKSVGQSLLYLPSGQAFLIKS